MRRILRNYLSLLILFSFLVSCHTQSKKAATAGICISFDDMAIKEWYSIRPLLQKYNAHVTLFVTLFHTLPPEEIQLLKELQSDGNEIGSHGAGHVLAESYIKEHSYADYLKNEIDKSVNSMRAKGFTPTSFSYPYGSKYWFTDYLLLKKFKVVRGVSPLNKEKNLTQIDNIYYDFDNDRTLEAIGIDTESGVSKKMVQDAIAHAAATNRVLLLYAHKPGETIDVEYLHFVLEEAQKKGLRFYRISDLVSE